jgi:prolipoprotein diacylglyceryltransferase
MTGCCYGKVCNITSLGVQFPKNIDREGRIYGSPPYIAHKKDGIIRPESNYSAPVYPIQIMESIGSSLIFGALSMLWKRKASHVNILVTAGISYGFLRFLFEYLRDDNPLFLLGLTHAQVVSIVVFVVCIVILARGILKNKKTIAV